MMRTSMLDVLGQDYIKTAKAKGLSQEELAQCVRFQQRLAANTVAALAERQDL